MPLPLCLFKKRSKRFNRDSPFVASVNAAFYLFYPFLPALSRIFMCDCSPRQYMVKLLQLVIIRAPAAPKEVF